MIDQKECDRILNIWRQRRQQSEAEQSGGAVTTRNQARQGSSTTENIESTNKPVITSKKRKFEDVLPVSNKRKSPEPEPSTSFQNLPSPPLLPEEDEDLTDYEREEGSQPELFDTVTTVYEDDTFQVNVVKEMFKRQKIFAIEDHSYVMRIKMKNKQSEKPFLKSLIDVLYTAFTFMINNLKTFIKPSAEEDNLIYLCIHQDSMTDSINSGSFRLQSVQTEQLVQDVLNMFENYVNSDSTIRMDSSFRCFFRVLSIPHVQYTKHRRKTVPKPEARIPPRLGCRLGRTFPIGKNSGLFDIPGIMHKL